MVDHSLVADELVSDHQEGLEACPSLLLRLTTFNLHVSHFASRSKVTFDFARQYSTTLASSLFGCQLSVPLFLNLPDTWAFFCPEDADVVQDRNLWVAKFLRRLSGSLSPFLSRPESSGLHMLVFSPWFLCAKSSKPAST